MITIHPHVNDMLQLYTNIVITIIRYDSSIAKRSTSHYDTIIAIEHYH